MRANVLTHDDLGLGPGAAALIGQDGSARGTHALVPPGPTCRFLVPLRPTTVAAAAVRSYTTPASARSRAALTLASWVARLGAVRLMRDVVPIGGTGTFVAHLSEILGTDLAVAVHLGPPRANRKPVLHLMDPAGRSLAFAKLGINELTCRRVRTEAAALKKVQAVETPGLVTPTPIASGTWRDLEYLVMKPVETRSRVRPSPGVRERATEALVDSFASHAAALGESAWWSRTVNDLDRCGDGMAAVRLRAVAGRVLERYGGQLIRSGAAHGDWSPWNMCLHQDHVTVWDWERFSLDVPRGWDSLHFAYNAYPGGARAALTAGDVRTSEVLAGQSEPEAEATVLSYLLNRGVNYLIDGQHEAGDRHGPLGAWLLPALEKRVDLTGNP